jgi:hypothetical protein
VYLWQVAAPAIGMLAYVLDLTEPDINFRLAAPFDLECSLVLLSPKMPVYLVVLVAKHRHPPAFIQPPAVRVFDSPRRISTHLKALGEVALRIRTS